MRDPHRLARPSACGFWLHLLAGPLIANPLGATLSALGGAAGAVMTTLAVGMLAVVALVVDRRSFLLAGVVYLALLVWQGLDRVVADEAASAATFLALGTFLVAVGVNWSALRGRLMTALPDFPGKDRLPPWTAPA